MFELSDSPSEIWKIKNGVPVAKRAMESHYYLT